MLHLESPKKLEAPMIAYDFSHLRPTVACKRWRSAVFQSAITTITLDRNIGLRSNHSLFPLVTLLRNHRVGLTKPKTTSVPKDGRTTCDGTRR